MQCPLHEEDSPFVAIAIGTSGDVEYFVARVLPSGACGSVLGFDRAAMALRVCVSPPFTHPVPHLLRRLSGVTEVVGGALTELAGRWQLREAETRESPTRKRIF